MENNKRESGYYWVKYKNREDWSIEYWNGGMWFTRNPTLVTDQDFIEIDEHRIERVTVHGAKWMRDRLI